MQKPRKIAIIGSFKTRERYAHVTKAIAAFSSEGWVVTSPAGADVIQSEIDFVRFRTDNPEHSDEEVQTRTLQNIFSADIVFVVAPEGYVGRTTCYEIGRLIQARRPVFFSETPRDLPISVDPQFVRSATDIAAAFRNDTAPFLFDCADTPLHKIERSLIGA